jgi:hypothetical protein
LLKLLKRYPYLCDGPVNIEEVQSAVEELPGKMKDE